MKEGGEIVPAVGRRFCNSSCALPGFRQTDTVGIVDQPSGRFIWKWELVIGYGTLKRLVDAREQASADTELSSNLQAKNYFGGTCSGSKYGGVSRERLGMSTAPGAHRGVGVGVLHVQRGDSQAAEKSLEP